MAGSDTNVIDGQRRADVHREGPSRFIRGGYRMYSKAVYFSRLEDNGRQLTNDEAA
jgi:hypothetical protein